MTALARRQRALEAPEVRSWLQENWEPRWWIEVGGTTYRLYDTHHERHRRVLAAIFAGVLRALGHDACRVRTARLGQPPLWHATDSVLRPAAPDEVRAIREGLS